MVRISRPSSNSSPDVALRFVVMIPMRVLFPAPFGPRRPQMPGWNVQEKSTSACFFPQYFVSFFASRIIVFTPRIVYGIHETSHELRQNNSFIDIAFPKILHADICHIKAIAICYINIITVTNFSLASYRSFTPLSHFSFQKSSALIYQRFSPER